MSQLKHRISHPSMRRSNLHLNSNTQSVCSILRVDSPQQPSIARHQHPQRLHLNTRPIHRRRSSAGEPDCNTRQPQGTTHLVTSAFKNPPSLPMKMALSTHINAPGDFQALSPLTSLNPVRLQPPLPRHAQRTRCATMRGSATFAGTHLTSFMKIAR